MSEGSKSCIVDSLKDVKHWKSILNLIVAANEIEDEKICENLACVVDYLRLSVEALEAILCEVEKK